MIRTLLVDDEPLARRGLAVLLRQETDVELVGEASDGEEAVERIAALEPDLVLLDVQMPELDGFEVVRRVAERHLPIVVFVSAHDRFALRAFEVHALDYLAKPVSAERLHDSIARVRRELAREDRPNAAGLARLVAPCGESAEAPLRRLVVKERDRHLIVRDDEVVRIEAAGNYVELHARGRCFLLRGTITDLAARLDPKRFARIHRSSIVNLECVTEIVPNGAGDFVVRLTNGEAATLSRRFRDRLLPRG